MKTKSLRQQVLDMLRKKKGYVHSGEIEKLALYEGKKGSTASRRAREMCSSGLLMRRLV